MLFFKREYKKTIKEINGINNYDDLKEILDKLNTNKFSKEKIDELKNMLYNKYKTINSDIFPLIIEYFYRKENILEFEIACFLLDKLHTKIEYLTNLENIKISEEKFFKLLPIICEIVSKSTTGIADCMYLILLNFNNCYDKIDEDYKKIIRKSLYKIHFALDYLKNNDTKPTIEMKKSLEIMVDVARLYNDRNILEFVENALDIDYIEINLFAVITLICNNVRIYDSYVEELARDYRTTKRFYKLLRSIGRLYRFPEEYYKQEHLAIGDMVQWLMHPAEIGDAPDEIELLETFERNNEIFYVFKFKSSKEEFKDKGWMIGISGGYEKDIEPTIDNSGYTFSDFEAYDGNNAKILVNNIINKIEKHREEYEKTKINK